VYCNAAMSCNGVMVVMVVMKKNFVSIYCSMQWCFEFRINFLLVLLYKQDLAPQGFTPSIVEAAWSGVQEYIAYCVAGVSHG